MLFTEKESEIINLVTSIAAGCQPCITYHAKKCIEAGIPGNEIYMAINQTEQIFIEAFEIMKLRALTDVNSNKKKEIGINIKYNNRRDVLMGLAVSYTLNSKDLFDFFLKHTVSKEISNKEISHIIETSKFIYDKAKVHVDILRENRGIENQVNENEHCSPGCGC